MYVLPHHRSADGAGYTNLNLPAKVVEDTTNALRLDPSYLKALNRRGMALEQMGGVDHLYSSLCGPSLDLALTSLTRPDFTAAAIIDNFKTDSTQVSVERVMKRLAQEKGTAMLRVRRLRLETRALTRSTEPRPAPAIVDVHQGLPRGIPTPFVFELDEYPC